MSDQIDRMTPNASPGRMSKKTGVRRVNNRPLYILATALGAFLLVMMLVAMDRAEKQNEPTQEPAEQTGSASIFAQEIVGDKDGGIVEPTLIISESDNPPMLIARPDNLDTPPPPPDSDNLSITQQQRDEEAENIRMTKLQMLQEAINAKTSVPVDVSRSSGSFVASASPQTRDEILARLATVRQQINAQTSDDPTTAYQAWLAQLDGSNSSAPQLLQTSDNRQNKNYSQFEGSSESDRWRLNSQPEAPRSPYELRAGFIVPATLISGINSDLPGQIMAQVSQNVYDTPTGKHLLIPQGARLVGSYSSEIIYGQHRVLVAWQRIVFPDGKAMDIGAMPGADSAGYSGLKDRVNNHYWRMFSSAFLMSGIVATVSLSQDNSSSIGNQQRARDALSEALGQTLGNTTAQLISKNLNVAPTLETRPGYRLNIIVTKDMTFSKPYQSFDY